MSQTIGDQLREARASQQLTVEDVAQRLRLMNRQVEAMETDDFASLGQPVFARGFVRNYARLLGLDPEPLVAGLRSEAPPTVVTLADDSASKTPMNEHRALTWLASPWLYVLAVGACIAIAIPVGLYLWLNSGDEPPPQVVVEPTPQPGPPPAAVVEPLAVPEANPDASAIDPDASGLASGANDADALMLDANGMPVPAVVPSAGNVPPVPAYPAQTNPAQTNPAQTNPAQTNPVQTNPALVPGAPRTTNPLTPRPFPQSAVQPPLPRGALPPVNSATAGSAATRSMELSFMADAWVEIRDANGKFVHRQLNRAGSRAVIAGKPPFDLVVGNAAQVRLRYAGRPLDLKPYIDITVARFTLEE